MNRNCIKTGVVSLLAFILLYYGVAWMVLRCYHNEDFANTDIPGVVSDRGAHGMVSSSSLESQDVAQLDCMGSDYHLETLAGFSDSLQQRILSDVPSRVTDASTMHGNETAERESLWHRALFDGRALVYPSDSPRYLSFSVLRI